MAALSENLQHARAENAQLQAAAAALPCTKQSKAPALTVQVQELHTQLEHMQQKADSIEQQVRTGAQMMSIFLLHLLVAHLQQMLCRWHQLAAACTCFCHINAFGKYIQWTSALLQSSIGWHDASSDGHLLSILQRDSILANMSGEVYRCSQLPIVLKHLDNHLAQEVEEVIEGMVSKGAIAC